MKEIVVGSGLMNITVEELKYSFFQGTYNKYYFLALIKNGVVFHSIDLNRLRLKYDFTNKEGVKFYDVVKRSKND